ncbi:MAG: redox-regulated ATPase YchF [Planctomycetes bacterium]|nr:redox-regulated ATPase YchF [Planctomycetota bacterium]
MKIGIIGLPGSGKSTLWCCLTGALEGPDPASIGKLQLRTVKVHDPRLERLRADYKPKKFTPATLEIADFPPMDQEAQDQTGIAQLLAPARQMDALIAVLRGFENPFNPPYRGRLDPLADWLEIRSELILSDLLITEKRLEKLEVQIKKATPTLDRDKKELDLLGRLKGQLLAEKDLVEFRFTEEEKKMVTGFQYLSVKPKIPIFNRGEAPPPADQVAALNQAIRLPVFVAAVRQELEILQLSPAEQEIFRKEFGLQPDTVDRIVAECYRAANRLSFFTAGDKEVRAWTLHQGDTAVAAAAAIHSDMARGFIRAETVSFEDYVRDGGIKGAKEKGHLRLEGKEYEVRDGDIVEFRFNA